jgi:glycine oxidase
MNFPKVSDVIVVGAGVVGLSIARELRKSGAGKITVLDKGQPGRESSWAAAGILAPQVEADYDDDFFRLCFRSNKMYRDFAAELLDETGVDIELDQRGVLYTGFDDNDDAEFERRFAWQTKAGLRVEKLSASEIRELEPNLSPAISLGLLFPDDGQVENRKLVNALIAYANTNKIELKAGVEVHAIAADGSGFEITTNAEIYRAATVVVATGAWTSFIQFPENILTVEVKPIRGQMICYQPAQRFDHVVYGRRGYLVPRADGRLLVGATVEDVGFDRTTTKEGINHLVSVGHELAPLLADMSVSESWSGFRPFSKGGKPVIGPVPTSRSLHIAVGHYRNGILLAPITAKLIADSVTGADGGWIAVNS